LKHFLVILSFFQLAILSAQTPFVTDGQLYAIESETGDFIRIDINELNGNILITTVVPSLGANISALSYRYKERLIYAIDNSNHHLIQIDALGNIFDLGNIGLPTDLIFNAGGIDRNGDFMLAVGSRDGVDQKLFQINLDDLSFEDFDISAFESQLVDFSFDPLDNTPYGFDASKGRVASIDEANGLIIYYAQIDFQNSFQSVYFNSFSELRGFGLTGFGVASAIFNVNRDTGRANVKATGPETYINDLVSLPYTVEIQNKILEKNVLPCTEFDMNFLISNLTGEAQTGIEFDLAIPPGFVYEETISNPFSGIFNYDPVSNNIHIENLIVVKTLDSMIFRFSIGDIDEGNFAHQATLSQIDAEWGSEKLSDDPETSRYRDATKMEVVRPQEANLKVERFLCLGETFAADYRDYGNNLIWHNGSTSPIFTISEPGDFYVEANNSCIDFRVDFDITFASCPYTIKLDYTFEPDTIYPCRELLMRYTLVNDSGLPHEEIHLNDTLPDQFTIIEVKNNPLNIDLDPTADPNVFSSNPFTLPTGSFDIELLVEVGELDPGLIYSRSVMSGFPTALGPFRLSDDPRTPDFDSTFLTIFGLAEDSLVIEELLCLGSQIEIDVTEYGFDPIWEDGSTEDIYQVDAPGVYEVVVDNGCEYKTVFFDVNLAPQIEVSIDTLYEIHVGETVELNPIISNQSDSLYFEWHADEPTLFDCANCLSQDLLPFDDASFYFIANNEVCFDSVNIDVKVDKTRRFYTGNIFSPNADGINDHFYIQSPDFTIIHQFQIVDRWGNLIFSTNDASINDASMGWDGKSKKGIPAPAGVYQWRAELSFIDGGRRWFFGDVSILR